MFSKKDKDSFIIRNAKLSDAKAISSLIDNFARRNIMLPKTPEEVMENIRNFIVAEVKGKIIGCAAFSFFTPELAEIRSVAVSESYHRKGVGSRLIEKAEEILKEEGIQRAFVLTLKESFFEKLGYRKVDKKNFPQKIWRDCLSCPKIMRCDEVAMEKRLTGR